MEKHCIHELKMVKMSILIVRYRFKTNKTIKNLSNSFIVIHETTQKFKKEFERSLK